MRNTSMNMGMVSIRGVLATGVAHACVEDGCPVLTGLHINLWVNHITAIAWPGNAGAAVVLQP